MSTPQKRAPARLAISPAQCRAARALLGWTQKDLAERSGVNERSLENFEAGHSVPFEKTMNALLTCFTEAGVEFVSTEPTTGVLLHRPSAPTP